MSILFTSFYSLEAAAIVVVVSRRHTLLHILLLSFFSFSFFFLLFTCSSSPTHAHTSYAKAQDENEKNHHPKKNQRVFVFF